MTGEVAVVVVAVFGCSRFSCRFRDELPQGVVRHVGVLSEGIGNGCYLSQAIVTVGGTAAIGLLFLFHPTARGIFHQGFNEIRAAGIVAGIGRVIGCLAIVVQFIVVNLGNSTYWIGGLDEISVNVVFICEEVRRLISIIGE